MSDTPDNTAMLNEKAFFDTDSLTYRSDSTTGKKYSYVESLLHGNHIRHNSYIAGDLGEVYTTHNDLSIKRQLISGKAVRLFCQKVYRLYQESQNLPQIQPPNNV
jgi:hypothetical protein